MQSDLDDPTTLLRRVEHGPALVHRVSGGLFHEHMGPGLHGCDRLERVPVVRGRDQDDLRLLLLQELTVVVVGLRLVAVEIRHLIRRHLADVCVHVAETHHLHRSACDGFLEDVLPPPTASDECGPVLLRRIGSADVRRGPESSPEHGGIPEKMATGPVLEWIHGSGTDGAHLDTAPETGGARLRRAVAEVASLKIQAPDRPSNLELCGGS